MWRPLLTGCLVVAGLYAVGLHEAANGAFVLFVLLVIVTVVGAARDRRK